MQPWGNSFLERTVLRKTILTGKPPGCVDQSACRHQLNVISRSQKVQNEMRACTILCMLVTATLCGCMPGGPQKVTLIKFTIDEPEPVQEFSYAPVVMKGDTLRYAPMYSK